MSHQDKESYNRRATDNKGTSRKVGSEFGAVIENDPQNYPNTGDWKFQIPIVDKETCIGCGTCMRNCPEAVILMKELGGKMKAVVDYQFCKGEGVCSVVCPTKAITMRDKNKNPKIRKQEGG